MLGIVRIKVDFPIIQTILNQVVQSTELEPILLLIMVAEILGQTVPIQHQRQELVIGLRLQDLEQYNDHRVSGPQVEEQEAQVAVVQGVKIRGIFSKIREDLI